MPGTNSSAFEENVDYEEISTIKMGETNVKYCTNPELILGFGLTSTVYPGYHFGIKKPAAVKFIRRRYLRVNHDPIKELEIWSKIDQNTNIIRLYDSYDDPKEGMYLAMEKAERTFKEQIRNFDNDQDDIISWLYQVSKAVEHLHGMGVTHKDIDPDNVLMVMHENHLFAKLADFGVSAMLKANFEDTENNSKNFKKMDVYDLGKLIYFGLSKGESIEKYTPSQYLNSDQLAAHDLIISMMERDVKNRFDISEVSSHCLFWNWKKVKDFFLSFAICLSKPHCLDTDWIKKQIDFAYKDYFEKRNQGKIFNWIDIAREYKFNIIDILSPNAFRKEYGNGDSVTKFIKLFRDKYVHHPEMRPPAAIMFSDGDGVFREDIYVKKFTSMFPGLKAVLYQVLSQNVSLYPLRSLSIVYFEEKLRRLSGDERGEMHQRRDYDSDVSKLEDEAAELVD